MRKSFFALFLCVSFNANAGVFSTIGKAAVDAVDSVGSKILNHTDDAAKHSSDSPSIPNSTGSKILHSDDALKADSPSFSEKLSQMRKAKGDGEMDLFDFPSSSLPNKTLGVDGRFENFWSWYLGLQATKVAAKNFKERSEQDQETVRQNPDFEEEVRIKDDDGQYNLGYLLNPIAEETFAAENDDDYVSGINTLIVSSVISGRMNFDPKRLVVGERFKNSSLIEFVHLYAALLSAAIVREDQTQTNDLKEGLSEASQELFSGKVFPYDRIRSCFGLIYTFNQFQYEILPGSKDVFQENCRHSQLSEGLSQMANFSSEISNEGLTADVLKKKAEVEVALFGIQAFFAALYRDEEEFLTARNNFFDLLEQNKLSNSELIPLSLGMIASSEFIMGNSQNAFRLSQQLLVLGQDDPYNVNLGSHLIATILMKEGKFEKAKEMIEIQRVMAHPDSEFFVPIDAKQLLLDSLLGLEFHLSQLDGA